MLLCASKFGTVKIERSFEMVKLAPLGGTIYFAVDETLPILKCSNISWWRLKSFLHFDETNIKILNAIKLASYLHLSQFIEWPLNFSWTLFVTFIVACAKTCCTFFVIFILSLRINFFLKIASHEHRKLNLFGTLIKQENTEQKASKFSVKNSFFVKEYIKLTISIS